MSSSDETKETIPELEGFKYGGAKAAAGKQGGQYGKTTKAISEYVGQKYGHDMKRLVEDGEEMDLEEPEYPSGAKPTDEEKAKWKMKYERYLNKQEKYDEHKAKVFNLILSRCEKDMRNRLESVREFKEACKVNDVVDLLRTIKDACFGSSQMNYPPFQAMKALSKLFQLHQGEKEAHQDYYKRFIGVVESVERSYGELAPTQLAKKQSVFASDKAAALSIERDKMLAFMFMDGADKKRFPDLMKSMRNDYALGVDKYPKTVEAALQVLEVRTVSRSGSGETPHTFAQVPGRGPKCWLCNEWGHKKEDCPRMAQAHATVTIDAQGNEHEAYVVFGRR